MLEQFANGRGEPRELAFAALVERHGPFVLRVCRSVLRDGDAAEDAFQATFLALARKAGSLWVRDSLAPWLHQAAYRAAVHDRSATIRRRSHEHAAAAIRPESVAPPGQDNDDDLEKIIHEEIDRLPGRFRVAVVLCDLEGRTHEQAAHHLGCAVGTVKSRLARGRQRLRGRLVRRGVAPATAMAASSAAGAARAAVPTRLAESTVVHAATAGAVPTSVSVITEGVLRAMFLRKVKLVMTAATVLAAIAAGAVALAQSGIRKPKDESGKPQHVGPSSWTYHILASLNGEPPRKVAVVEMIGDTPIRVDTAGALILFQPKRDGEPDRQTDAERGDQESHQIVLTRPMAVDVTIPQQYVCQIHAHRHIDIRALEKGYLDEIKVREGQSVKRGDLLFKIVPTLSKAKADAELAETEIAQQELNNTRKLAAKKVVAENEVKLFEAKLARAQAKANLALAGSNPATVTAPFDGLIGRLLEQQGSLVKEGDAVTTLSDNSVMWVYFNLPEKRYLEYMAETDQNQRPLDVVLTLANRSKFPQVGKIGAIEAQFNNQTGNIAFRADFPNPDGVLRHGQSGIVVIQRKVHDAIVIPSRATYEIADKRYVYVVNKADVVHRREVVVRDEMDDIFVIEKGVGVGDRIVLEGIRQVRDGEKVKYAFRPPQEVMRTLKNPAE